MRSLKWRDHEKIVVYKERERDTDLDERRE